jgi:hypothetical protein
MVGWIKKLLAGWKARQEAEREKERDGVRKQLARQWDAKEVESLNISIIMNSAGWIGGSYTEQDLKRKLLASKRHLFKAEEYEQLYRSI